MSEFSDAVAGVDLKRPLDWCSRLGFLLVCRKRHMYAQWHVRSSAAVST